METMRKLLFLFKIFVLISIQFVALRAEMGCMDNSFHLDSSKGCDNKKYHYVQCSCPCNEYRQSFNRGCCDKCLHYRDPQSLEFIKYAGRH